MEKTISRARLPAWLWVAAGLGLAWNVFGVVQFVSTLAQSRESLMMGGMTAEQATLYHGLPAWMQIAFATGVFGGLAGCVALMMGHRVATSIFLISLLGYVALYVGDYLHGLFDVMPSQMAILTAVVLIAVALYAVARIVERKIDLV